MTNYCLSSIRSKLNSINQVILSNANANIAVIKKTINPSVFATVQNTKRHLDLSKPANAIVLHYPLPHQPLFPIKTTNKLNISACDVNKNVGLRYCSNSTPNSSSDENPGLPSPDQLEHIRSILVDELPATLTDFHNYEMYHKDLVFIDNIRGKKTVGLMAYQVQIAWLKLIVNIKFVQARLCVLKLTKHKEDGTIRVRWCIKGIKGREVMFTFWKFNVFRLNDAIEEAPVWHDGFSVFYVGSHGLIYKHVVDKMQPDDDRVTEDKPVMTPKLALFSEVNKLSNSFLSFR